MDARNLGIEVINEIISIGDYEITGVLETGEIILALITDDDRKFIYDVLESSKSLDEKLKETKKLRKIKGRQAHEIIQVYEQKCCLNYPRCKKNNLIIRSTRILI